MEGKTDQEFESYIIILNMTKKQTLNLFTSFHMTFNKHDVQKTGIISDLHLIEKIVLQQHFP